MENESREASDSLIWVTLNQAISKGSSCNRNKMRVIFTQGYGKNQFALTYLFLPQYILFSTLDKKDLDNSLFSRHKLRGTTM